MNHRIENWRAVSQCRARNAAAELPDSAQENGVSQFPEGEKLE
jgi:hypothetical protein